MCIYTPMYNYYSEQTFGHSTYLFSEATNAIRCYAVF